jgi:acetyltransferase-like isoleucine patch superfamily enzyme
LVELDRAEQPDGRVLVECPARLSNAVFSGDCSVGAFTYFNHGAEVNDAKIGRYCSIGQRALIGPGAHHTHFATTHPIGADPSGVSAGMERSARYRASVMTVATRIRAPAPATVIDHDVWIGANVVVMSGVHVGVGAIIGAGAVVTRDVAPYAVMAGVPARLVRFRLQRHIQEALLDSRWWARDLSALPMRDYSDPEAFLREIALHNPPPLDPPTIRTA